MRLATVKIEGQGQAAILTPQGLVPIEKVNAACGTMFPLQLFDLIVGGHIELLKASWKQIDSPTTIDMSEADFDVPYRRPGKIWGIGLNYKAHAGDLDETTPSQPASFMKPATAIIGPADAIRLPAEVGCVTAEAELGVIIGRKCRKISLEEAQDYVFGYTTIIDMTALDILRQNPRYLTRAKSFDTFFSFGPVIVTTDEVTELSTLKIQTLINGTVQAENVVSNMTFNPLELVAYHSHVMTLEPGDIISTGTPGAGAIKAGDVVRCEIEGIEPLENNVIDDTNVPIE